jgi:quinol-cytochrome oxidoreductase complex cytochrome b subunit
MFVAILILLILPFVDTSKIKGSTYKPLHILAFWLFAFNFLILMWLGSCHVEAKRHLTFFYRDQYMIHHCFHIMMIIQKLSNTAPGMTLRLERLFTTGSNVHLGYKSEKILLN